MGINFAQLFAAFAGGVFGAAFGGMSAFIFCGLSSLIGGVITLVTGDPKFNAVITWGPFLGPHVAFAGGVAAAAYAAKTGRLESGRNVATPLFGLNSPAVLAAGGTFGVLGMIIKTTLDAVPGFRGVAWTNSIALSIMISAGIVRLAFGKSGLIGKPSGGRSRWRAAEDASWEPWPSEPLQLILVAAAVSLAAGSVDKALPGSFGLVFGLAALTLPLYYFGARIPIILHIAWSAEYAVLLTKDIGWGLVFGILAAVLADLFACLFLIHGDTHIDPPAMSVMVIFSLCPALAGLGVLKLTGWPSIMLASGIASGGYLGLRFLRRAK